MEPTRSTLTVQFGPAGSSATTATNCFTTTLSWNLPDLPTLFVPPSAQNGQKGSPKGLSAVPTTTALLLIAPCGDPSLPSRAPQHRKRVAVPALASFLFQLTCTGTGTASGPLCGDPFWPFWAAGDRKRVAALASPLGIELRTYELEVRWSNHWATGTLSGCRPRQK